MATRKVRPGFETCQCPGPHHEPLVPDHHHLDPLGWGGPDTASNLARGCPNVHRLAHTLQNAMKRAGGRLPYREAIRYGVYAKRLAELGWDLAMARGLTPATVAQLPDVGA